MKCTTFLLQLDPTGEESLFPLDNVSNENVMKLPLDISYQFQFYQLLLLGENQLLIY